MFVILVMNCMHEVEYSGDMSSTSNEGLGPVCATCYTLLCYVCIAVVDALSQDYNIWPGITLFEHASPICVQRHVRLQTNVIITANALYINFVMSLCHRCVLCLLKIIHVFPFALKVNTVTIPIRMLSAPVPGEPLNTDAPYRTTRAIPPAMLSDSYLPAVMQAVAYYVELLQYEVLSMTTVEPPFTLATQANDPLQQKPQTATTAHKKPIGTTTPPTTHVATTRRTTQKPTTASSIFVATSSHKPGYFAPQPVVQELIISQVDQNINDDKSAEMEETTAPPPTKPTLAAHPLLSISSDQFFSWFLQMKDQKISQDSGNQHRIYLN